jgi:hypothetical protein
MPITVGAPIFSDQLAGADSPWWPPGSTALLSAEHDTVCSPTPRTGTLALAPANHSAGPPSIEHENPSIPDGPSEAVAVTYWVPAVDGASVGPDNSSVGVELSTSTVFVGSAVTPAVLVAVSLNNIVPSPRPMLPFDAPVSTTALTLWSGHWCQACLFGLVSGVRVAIAGRLPNATAALHTPEGVTGGE